MTVRDLGYRAYEGELHSRSHTTLVMLRYGLWRIWGSWVNKLLVFAGILPFGLFAVLAGIRYAMVGPDVDAAPAELRAQMSWFLNPDLSVWLRSLSTTQFWCFVTILSFRSGAAIVAEDFTNKAYQFYFAKPVTAVQYLIGRVSALAIFIFGIIFVPSALLIVLGVAIAPEDGRLSTVGLLIPAAVEAIFLAVTTSGLAVAVSSLSRSRGLTRTIWLVLLFVPLGLASLVETITESEWGHIISFPSMQSVLADAIYKVHDDWDQFPWYVAAGMLTVLTAGGLYLALRRIEQAEVVT